ncbi:MAG: FAD-binding protein [Chloroherpetonaceae bacterium]|nr:FAD-binding protein [Chloroherpetonaceae bacterium]MDW8437775.1 FAD-linked oxidase C-terminal domain-containing protein [Chloroherpetonaceae bacterium]
MISASALKALREIVGRENYLDSEADKLLYSYDGTPMLRQKPDAVVIPRSADVVSKILRLANDEGFAVVPRGSGSGLSGGSVPVPNSVVLLFPPMNKILSIDEVNLTAKVEAGVITARLQSEVEKRGLFYPPDPGSANISTVGGNVAENAGGLRGLKYGVTKNYVLALDVILPSGEPIALGSESVKDVQGLNLRDIFIGSEGALGIFTTITLRLLPKPEHSVVMMMPFDSIATVGEFVAETMLARITPAMLEFLDRNTIRAVEDYAKLGLPTNVAALVLVELDGYKSVVEAEAQKIAAIARKLGASSIASAETLDDATRLKLARKSAFSALARLKPTTILEDASVPRSKLPEMLLKLEEFAKQESVLVGNFGHLGDGNLHPTCLINERDSDEVRRSERFFERAFETAVKFGGAITGEHGTGLAKKKYLEMATGKTQVDLMRKFKQILDPNNVLNPSKMFDIESLFRSKCERKIARPT